MHIELLRPARKGEAERAGSQLFKPLRQVIESINETFKGQRLGDWLDRGDKAAREPGCCMPLLYGAWKRPVPRSEPASCLRALGGTRTPNLLIRSQMLYPLSYERSGLSIQCPARWLCSIGVHPQWAQWTTQDAPRANVRRHRAAGGGAGMGPSGTPSLVYDQVPRATFILIFCTTIHVYEE